MLVGIVERRLVLKCRLGVEKAAGWREACSERDGEGENDEGKHVFDRFCEHPMWSLQLKAGCVLGRREMDLR